MGELIAINEVKKNMVVEFLHTAGHGEVFVEDVVDTSQGLQLTHKNGVTCFSNPAVHKVRLIREN